MADPEQPTSLPAQESSPLTENPPINPDPDLRQPMERGQPLPGIERRVSRGTAGNPEASFTREGNPSIRPDPDLAQLLEKNAKPGQGTHEK